MKDRDFQERNGKQQEWYQREWHLDCDPVGFENCYLVIRKAI